LKEGFDVPKEGFDVPKDLPENGLIVKKGILKAGVWVMPKVCLKILSHFSYRRMVSCYQL
jgi:hypothetical protein